MTAPAGRVGSLAPWTMAIGTAVLLACGGPISDQTVNSEGQEVSVALLQQRSDAIKAAHAGHPSIHNPLLFAGIAYVETKMAHCYSEYVSQVGAACAGPASASCGNGSVTAGYADGICANQQGGLGMFQFDEGTYSQTLAKWTTSGYWNGQTRDVLDLQGNIAASIDFVLFKAWASYYTPAFASYQAMYDWINGIRPVDGNAEYERWLGFLANSYNGLAWNSSGWSTVKETYRSGTRTMYTTLGGDAYWYATSTNTPPATPTSIAATALDSSRIQVTWAESSNQTGFYVYDGVSFVRIDNASARSYVWTGLAPGTYKCTFVLAFNASGNSSWSNQACVTTPATATAPATPTSIAATALDSSQIQVTWAESSSQTGFYVYDGVSFVRIDNASARSYVWTGLAPGTYKCTFVLAFNAYGNSSWSDQACVTTPANSTTVPLLVPYLRQYKGQASQNVDCGPAAVAMAVQYRNKRPAGLGDGAFITQVRRNGGVGDDTSYTNFGNLETALGSYGLTWSEVSQNLSPAPAAQFQAMWDATRAGKPVIALVNGPTLGRGSNYGDHWVVVTGVSSDGQTVYLNDPDDQAARWSGWIVGGQITLSATTFTNALWNAAPGSYGIVVN